MSHSRFCFVGFVLVLLVFFYLNEHTYEMRQRGGINENSTQCSTHHVCVSRARLVLPLTFSTKFKSSHTHLDQRPLVVYGNNSIKWRQALK